MIEVDIFTMVSQFGFPIVAFFMMYQMVSGTIKENTKAINEMILYLKTGLKL